MWPGKNCENPLFWDNNEKYYDTSPTVGSMTPYTSLLWIPLIVCGSLRCTLEKVLSYECRGQLSFPCMGESERIESLWKISQSGKEFAQIFPVVWSFPLEVWVATDDRRILLYAGADPENGCEVGRIMLPAAPLCQVIGLHHWTLYCVSFSLCFIIISLPYHAGGDQLCHALWPSLRILQNLTQNPSLKWNFPRCTTVAKCLWVWWTVKYKSSGETTQSTGTSTGSSTSPWLVQFLPNLSDHDNFYGDMIM